MKTQEPTTGFKGMKIRILGTDGYTDSYRNYERDLCLLSLYANCRLTSWHALTDGGFDG